MTGLIGALIIGLVAGFIARALMPGKDSMGVILTIVLGIVGAVVGFFLFTELLGIGDGDAFDFGSLVGSVIGAMIVLGVWRFIGDRGSRGTLAH